MIVDFSPPMESVFAEKAFMSLTPWK